jgi:hypothetical protein
MAFFRREQPPPTVRAQLRATAERVPDHVLVPARKTSNIGALVQVEWVNNYREGDFRGTGVFYGIKQYSRDDTYSIIGYERLDGRIGNPRGTFVLLVRGAAARVSCRTLPPSPKLRRRYTDS